MDNLTQVIAKVPATTANLGPGFDCLGMAVQLYNRLEFELAGEAPLTISISGSEATEGIPTDEHNLVYRAARRVFDTIGSHPERLTMRLELESPLARGLGSSASAIAGGIAAANALMGSPLNEQQMLALMLEMEGHPDNIVPCLVGGLTASLALENQVLYIRREPAACLDCVLLIPAYELATVKARQAIPKSIPHKDAVSNLSRIPFILDRLASGDFTNLSNIMEDQLHQPYRESLIKAYDEVSERATAAGANAVCISGAGPTILAIATPDTSANVAAAMQGALNDIDIPGRAIVVKPDLKGIILQTS